MLLRRALLRAVFGLAALLPLLHLGDGGAPAAGAALLDAVQSESNLTAALSLLAGSDELAAAWEKGRYLHLPAVGAVTNELHRLRFASMLEGVSAGRARGITSQHYFSSRRERDKETFAVNTHDYEKNATMAVADVHRELENHATWVSNMAHSVWSDAAAAALATQSAFGLPAHANVYCTGAGADVSLAPHTDRQDVVILQLEGTKRWHLYAPPEEKSLPVERSEELGKWSDAAAASPALALAARLCARPPSCPPRPLSQPCEPRESLTLGVCLVQ